MTPIPEVTLLTGDAARDFVATRWPAAVPAEFVTRQWCLAAWDCLPDLGAPAVLVAVDGARWCALPLSRATDGGKPRYSLPGWPMGDQHDAVVSDPGAGSLAVPLLHALVELAGPDDGSGPAVLLGAVDPTGSVARAARSGPWNIQTEPAPEITIATMAVTDSGRRRRLHRLAGQGAVDLTIVDGPDLSYERMAAFVVARMARWRENGRQGELPPFELTAACHHFLADVASSLAGAGLARLHVLSVDSQVVSAGLFLGPRSDPLFYMCYFATAFAAYSPGRVLLEETLGRLRDEGAVRLRTGRGSEAYKFVAGADDSVVLHLRPTTVEGDGHG